MSEKDPAPITLDRPSTAIRPNARRDVDALRRAAGILTVPEGAVFLRERGASRVRAAIASGRIRFVRTPAGELVFAEDLAALLRQAAGAKAEAAR
jgi:hypothetical protein